MANKGNPVHKDGWLKAIPNVGGTHWCLLKWQGKFGHNRMDSEKPCYFCNCTSSIFMKNLRILTNYEYASVSLTIKYITNSQDQSEMNYYKKWDKCQ